MRLVRAQLDCAQMGNAVKDQCHGERCSVDRTALIWVVRYKESLYSVQARKMCSVQARKMWRSTGYKP